MSNNTTDSAKLTLIELSPRAQEQLAVIRSLMPYESDGEVIHTAINLLKWVEQMRLQGNSIKVMSPDGMLYDVDGL